MSYMYVNSSLFLFVRSILEKPWQIKFTTCICRRRIYMNVCGSHSFLLETYVFLIHNYSKAFLTLLLQTPGPNWFSLNKMEKMDFCDVSKKQSFQNITICSLRPSTSGCILCLFLIYGVSVAVSFLVLNELYFYTWKWMAIFYYGWN